MDKDVKGSKTYTMDELLQKCGRRGGPYSPNSLALIKTGSQTTGGMDWIENPTRFKLKETKYFLDKVLRAYVEYVKETTDENRDELLFNLSAFIAAGRSITGNYMQNQYGDDWYKKQKFEFDQELMLLNEMRVEFVHLKPHGIATERGLTYPVTARVVYAEGDPRRLTAPPLPEIQPSEPVTSEPVTYVVVLRPDDKMKGKIPGLADEYNVLEFCNRQYEKYEKLVDECERRFASQKDTSI